VAGNSPIIYTVQHMVNWDPSKLLSSKIARAKFFSLFCTSQNSFYFKITNIFLVISGSSRLRRELPYVPSNYSRVQRAVWSSSSYSKL